MKSVESSRRFVKAYCKDAGIEFVESKLCKVPFAAIDPKTGRKRIVVPLLSSLNFDEWCRQVFHETGHLEPDNLWHYDIVDAIKKEGRTKTHELMANCIVDNMAERTNYKVYRGRAEILSSARMPFSEKFDNKVDDQGLPTDQDRLTMALVQLDMRNREKWMINYSSPFGHRSIEGVDEYRDKLEAMRVYNRIDEIYAMTDHTEATQKVVQLVDEVMALLPAASERQEPQEGGKGDESDSDTTDQQTGENFGGAEEGDSDPTEGTEQMPSDDEEESVNEPPESSESSTGDDEAEGAEDNSETGEDSEPGSEGVEEQAGDAAGNDSSEESSNERTGEDETSPQNNSDGKQDIHELPSTPGLMEDYNPALDRDTEDLMAKDTDELIESEYKRSGLEHYLPCTRQSRVKISSGRANTRRQARILELFGESNLDRQVRKHLQLRSTGRVQHGLKRGRVSSKSLHRLYHNKGVVQPAVFKKNIAGEVKMDSVLSLLMDCSGSMGDSSTASKFCLAAASVLSLSEVLKGLRIRYEILGFTEDGSHNVFMFKTFEERQFSADKMAARLSSNQVSQWYNTDGESLQYAAERLMLRKERNKILMVLSDGRPALKGYGQGSPAFYLEQVAKDVENNSPIHLCAIGIESDDVQDFYSNYRVINRIDQLGQAVLETLSTNLLTV